MNRLLIFLFAACLAHAQSDFDELHRQVAELRALVERLQARVDTLEKSSAQTAFTAPAAVPPPAPAPAPQPSAVAAAETASANAIPGATINFLMDGYYGYNFNSPIGRDNLLRAYDVSSNSFSLNQADLVVDAPPDPEQGRAWGARVDLQFGQATETLQGNPVNEPRPDIYRNIYQAYGTYVFPFGHGLTVDFGKWSSSIGIETNYTKDNMNYSRSFWYDFLPFYHMGVRASYKVDDALTLNYWVTNGTEQTEAYNGFKDELIGAVLQPRKNLNWTMNYYVGQEHPDVIFYPNGAPAGLTNLPTLQGVPFQPIPDAPGGHLHIIDSYATWQPLAPLTFALEGDYVIEREYTNSSPQHTDGGAAYVNYQFTPRLALSTRAEYLSDRGGLFSGKTQALKENTVTLAIKLSGGFLTMLEWRRDFSNQPEFLTNTLGILKKDQTTATMGLVWWFGRKQGPW